MALSPEAQAQLAELATTLAHNPKTRKQFVKLVQEIDPSKRFADVETDELRDSIESKFAERDQQDAARKTRERLEAQRNGLISSGRFKSEDVEKMEKEVMEKHGISDYEVAAKVYAADMKPASPTSEIKSRTWSMPTMTKETVANPGKHALDTAYSVIDELRGRKSS